ncbi:transporter [Niabella soli DSM 19437]|uniref:Transporter n=2 Tax=Niabella TaxID=379899 RepID=W0EZ94_9BACT|nr:transporter [Niabella soli DSM 19437]
MMWESLSKGLAEGATKAIARAISLVENEVAGYDAFLAGLQGQQQPVIGITGPPGAGKSTLTDALIGLAVRAGKKVAVICVDPSSPFHLGALLGDRIRLSQWYLDDRVFIRSLASRGALGGLHPKIMEITDLLKAAPFDLIIVETVGVGQSEVDIAGLADVTVVVLVPEAGDEIQTMKAGLMEVADIFVVNKSDRPGADLFAKNLRQLLAPAFSMGHASIPVIATVAHTMKGVEALYTAIEKAAAGNQIRDRKTWLLTEKAWQLIQKKRMADIDKTQLAAALAVQSEEPSFNLYKFIQDL